MMAGSGVICSIGTTADKKPKMNVEGYLYDEN